MYNNMIHPVIKISIVINNFFKHLQQQRYNMFDIRATGQENEFVKYKHNHSKYILNNT